MVANKKHDFAERLNKACDEAESPVTVGRGRRAELRRRVAAVGLDVSGESVRKWLSADSIPSMDNIRFIAIALGVDADWLLTGRKVRRGAAEPDPALLLNEPAPVIYGNFNSTIAQVIDIMSRLENDEQQQILGFAKAIQINANPADQNSTARTGS